MLKIWYENSKTDLDIVPSKSDLHNFLRVKKMPHHCAGVLSYQYHGILGFLMSDEGGRLIEMGGALAGTYTVAPWFLRKVITAFSWTMLIAILVSGLSNGAVAKVAHQLSPCFSVSAIPNAAPELIASLMKERTAPSLERGGFSCF